MGGHIRQGDGLGQGIEHLPPQRGGDHLLALLFQVSTLEQNIDDTGLRGRGTQPVGVPEDFLEFGVLDIAGNTGHRLEQRPLRKMLGRRGLLVVYLGGFTPHGFALAQRG